MEFLITFAFVVVISLASSAPVGNNVTEFLDSAEDAANSTAANNVPEITIFRIDKRSDKEKFLEAIRSARKLWNGDYMYQRDIRITRAQLEHIYGVDTTKDETFYAWPNATVPFVIGRKVRGFAREIRDAMRQWEQETCVRFIEITQEAGNIDHVRFVQSRWAYSYLGKQGGSQKVGIPSIYFPDTHYAHLLGHAIGLRHTHADSSRDTFYFVAWDSVPNRYRYNFDHESPAYGSRTKISALESEFEFDWSSVMADESESVEGDVDFMLQDRRVVYPADPFYLYRTTSTERASFLEYKKVNQLYKCNERCPNANSSRCQHGGYVGPKCSCVCPPGAVGDHCEHRTTNAKAGICGEVLQENKTVHFVSRPSSYHCTWWIRTTPPTASALVTCTSSSETATSTKGRGTAGTSYRWMYPCTRRGEIFSSTTSAPRTRTLISPSQRQCTREHASTPNV
nr:zinc metalloproteinase nas-25-like isoform X2 [Dermacentor andersoni]